MAKRENHTDDEIISIIESNDGLSSSQIHTLLNTNRELVTTKRRLSKLVRSGSINISGTGKSTRYHISPSYRLFRPIDIDRYFKQDIDSRNAMRLFNHDLLETVLPKVSLFTDDERNHLEKLQSQFRKNLESIPASIYKIEMERLAIDLSWKSSQIEGNTYSLLETEQLLKEHKEAKGKKKEEARMLLNHKDALDFIISDPSYIYPLTVSKIENIHKILVDQLAIDFNIRKRLVGITGTNYRPLDNGFQIRKALEKMCIMVNKRKDVFEKALLVLLLISYIQPFADGNKRTARIICNAILIHFNYCPLSFRTVDSMDYKMVMLLFYEQNSMRAFKTLFIEQYEFAVSTYFATKA